MALAVGSGLLFDILGIYINHIKWKTF